MQKSTFNIYNASAGSGKTFTLTKSYLKILLSSKNPEYFKNLLAITFTNKAVGEMKDRIIQMLKLFSSIEGLEQHDSMFKTICEELKISPKSLHHDSKLILKHIIHNYGAFEVSTIDGFTHRIIRTFAQDLKLPVNFEVELDAKRLLTEAVDSLISKAGTDSALTKLLIDFAIEKAEEDKSWDISYDFEKISSLLINENDSAALRSFENKTLDDFKQLKTKLIQEITNLEKALKKEAETTLNFIEECGLQFDDFSRKSLPNHFKNLSDSNISIKFDLAWQSDLLDAKALYPKRVTPEIATIIDTIQPHLAEAYTNTKTLVFRLKLKKGLYNNITPLSVLNAIQAELNTIKKEQNKLLISEFNSLISNEIKDQPTPFIYERLGEKYKHYFIDEFQDTSVMQWTNLIPLIDNALSASNGSLMLVGDAKQAIYRWRGGKVEQFIELYNRTSNPFQVDATIEPLETNYRSARAIVNFNNSFFNFVSGTYLTQENYASLYNGSKQNTHNEKEGFVKISFVQSSDQDEDVTQLYIANVYETIQNCLNNGYELKDICVLVRKHKEGVLVSDFLSNNSIPITSSETLLIENSEKVVFLNNLIKLLLQPENAQLQIEALTYIAKIKDVSDKHLFFKTHFNKNSKKTIENLSQIGYGLNINTLLEMPIYELIEELIRVFDLNETSDAFLQYYLDFVLEFTQKQNSDLSQFIDFFEQKKDKLSITTPQNLNAVNIMTIHKSKGLEFPVIIFPFASLNIYHEIEPRVWFPVDPKENNGFSQLLLNFNKDIEHFNEIGNTIYNEHQSQLELDNINLLYVALTRAVERLYIVSKEDFTKSGEPNPKTYSGMFISYLKSIGQWNEASSSYEFGTINEKADSKKETTDFRSLHLISTRKEDHNLNIVTKSGLLWDTKQEKAIEKGNIIHNLLSKIKTKDDVSFALDDMVTTGEISEDSVIALKSIAMEVINHEQIKHLFSNNYTIYNERELITNRGVQIRPDRLNINPNNEVIITDYKTGSHKPSHTKQIQGYEAVLKEMKLTITNKYLVYINEAVNVIEV
ncbi:UvrD-helicase domain-containing protein [Winogradskyella alexanderae]|uniref:DNA 3'-5' helicase n=1 Tax=Winogradskyella alexanderae TaxID=2877123 RepID=A0ABS7XMG5_9FLAO|nr:UvrD-helicase domain-containing protein [Winogradskyella alexanderae]MCA0131192.1 UvrD-helicase domain-containing protein [Winogradskyella alexanderae]